MPFDAVFLTAVSEELKKTAVGAKIDKIQQPERDELLLSLRGPGGNCKLLLSAASGRARIHVSTSARENPEQPPMFCMRMRKHLAGGKIIDVYQPVLERIADISVSVVDEMGELSVKHLVLEMTGRNSNIILIGQDGIIIDCLRKTSIEKETSRLIQPGMIYEAPPAQDKKNLLDLDENSIACMLAESKLELKAEQWLLQNFFGLSPLVCRELSYRIIGSADIRICEVAEEVLLSFPGKLKNFAGKIKDKCFEPWMLVEESRPYDFSYMPILQYGEKLKCLKYETFSQLLDDFYGKREAHERMGQKSRELVKRVKTLRDRTARKLAIQQSDLKETYDREKLRECGDLIKANIHRMESGMTVLKAEDFYDPDYGEREIKLDPRLSPQQNAAKYYKSYTKAKNAERYLTEQIERGVSEIEYFDSVLEELERAETERDLSDIRQELTNSGYLKLQKAGNRNKKTEISAPMRFTSTEGFEILVGRNNMQNERLTLKVAMRNDIWMHVQKMHGAHVIIASHGESVGDKTMEEASELAAYYSKGRGGAKVPVDYTLVKYVKKLPGGKPGMVAYTNYKTIFAEADESVAERLKQKRNK